MDMAPNRAEMIGGDAAEASGRPAGDARRRVPCPSLRALETLQRATQATMMMAMVWPLIASVPFFWAPPFWVWSSIGRDQPRDESTD